jgi:hypothetical protein
MIFSLILGLFVLIAAGLRVSGLWSMTSTDEQATMIPVVKVTGTLSGRDNLMPGTFSIPLVTPTLKVTLIGPTSPADEWANQVLDKFIVMDLPQPSGLDNLAWWQNPMNSDFLTLREGFIYAGQMPVVLSDISHLEIAVPDVIRPGLLRKIASVEKINEALQFSLYSARDSVNSLRWIVSADDMQIALESLIVQAASREFVIQAAISSVPSGGESEIVLLAVEPYNRVLQFGNTGTISPTRQLLPIETTATATRVADVYLGQLLAASLNPILETINQVPVDVVKHYRDTRPRVGLLEWQENGPILAGMPMGTAHATELHLYALSANSGEGDVVSLLVALYDGRVTRLPDFQVYFQGHRMDEILHWLTVIAAQKNGQLEIAYDDLGIKQSITILSFKKFE